ncbi:MerR family transcriptional regulator [Conexibacter woesei]|uniref:MerR family transcriptional regulator n=1 Tax=Conexibacter woesei TaxID=191495 RepID=UPI0004060FC3|nr:MerR family transcriptional regulator [Conexibacter woesei]
MSAVETTLRIGEVAKRLGITTRTIRYYEELGLLGGVDHDRAAGQHRTYTEADVERLRKAVKLKSLLGVSLEELKTLMEAEDGRDARREEFTAPSTSKRRRREILDTSALNVTRQLELLTARRAEFDQLEAELIARRNLITTRRAELG